MVFSSGLQEEEECRKGLVRTQQKKKSPIPARAARTEACSSQNCDGHAFVTWSSRCWRFVVAV